MRKIVKELVSLYVRDNDVSALAQQVQQDIKVPDKTEAVRIALRNEVKRARQAIPLKERIKQIQNDIRAMGSEIPATT